MASTITYCKKTPIGRPNIKKFGKLVGQDVVTGVHHISSGLDNG